MDPYEVKMHRRNTVEYIESDPTSVILSRQERVRDSSGGFRKEGPPGVIGGEGGQRMRLVASGTQLPVRNTLDGQEIAPEYMLIGLWDADIRRGDWFYKDGIKYEIVFVHPDPIYETLAEVAYRG